MAATGPVQVPASHESPVQQPLQAKSGSPDDRPSKRQKVTRACDNCKSRKRRCTGELPCQACHANGSRCTYLASYTRGRLVQPQAGNHGDDIRMHVQQASTGVQFTSPPVQQSTLQPAVRVEQTYHPEATTKASRASSPEGGNAQYLGPSPWSFLRRAWKRFEEDGTNNVSSVRPEEPSPLSSIFTYGDRPAPPVDVTAFQLPPRGTTSTLVQHYFDLAMPTYRFLHRGTVLQWLEAFHEAEERGYSQALRSSAKEAVVLAVLATARLFNVDDRKEILDPDECSWADSELLYQMAQAKLQSETGRAKLESVQARIASCLFLLQSSRPNQAWYLFGTTAQLIFSLGLHRSDNWTKDAVVRECRKRTFWACSTLDTYLSVVKGVPPLISLDDVDQKLPDAIDDEDLTASGVVSMSQTRGDSVVKASILHAQITRIVKRAAREQYLSEKKKSSQKMEMAAKLNAETDAWHASLPVVLSGAIHPSSLIAIFRRQITVLQLAYAHAQMLINRPSLLVESSQSGLREAQVQTCLTAAKSTLDTILTSFNKHIFQSFWFTQFVSFNALSIVYIWLIQRKHSRLPPLSSHNEDELLQLAQTVQQHLVDATEANAPSLRYSIVLDELQQEVRRLQPHRPPHLSALLETSNGASGSMTNSPDALGRVLGSVENNGSGTPGMDLMGGYGDFPLDPDLWLTLDSFPFSDYGPIT